MACSPTGILAIVMLLIAFTLNTISLILPLWSSSNVVNDTTKAHVKKADFTAGVWGFCTDAELYTKLSTKSKNESTISFEHCYFFHTSSKYELPTTANDIFKAYANDSVCNGYDRAKKEEADDSYITSLAEQTGMDAGQLDQFLHKSCSALGSATLVIGMLSAVCGAFAIVCLLLGITCCNKKSWLVAIGKWVTAIASIMAFLTFILWIPQAHPLGRKDHVALSGSFVMDIIATVLYLIAFVLVARHAALYSSV